MLLVFSLSIILPFILMMMNSLIAKKSTSSREKSSPFECGFDISNNARIPFSIRFYLIALIFLIFDVEITLILPIPIVMTQMSSKTIIMTSMFFFIILIMGLLHEWNEGALNWDA